MPLVQAIPAVSLTSSPAPAAKKETRDSEKMEVDLSREQAEDNAPLFYSPGKRGFYSPRMARPTEIRMNAFRNVGRLIGLCLLQNELCPLFLNRHVIKVPKVLNPKIVP